MTCIGWVVPAARLGWVFFAPSGPPPIPRLLWYRKGLHLGRRPRAAGSGRSLCRASGHRRRPRPQAACQDRQDRLPASADAAGRGAAARVLGAAAADPGVPGAAGDLSRPAGRAYGVGAADPRGVLPPGRPRLGESFLRSEQGMAALRAASAAHLSPAGQMQIGTALEMIAVLEDRLHDVRRQVQEAAAALAGARALRERLYGVGPITALGRACWVAGAARFSPSRKAVRFPGLDISVWSSDRKGRPGRLSREAPPVLRWAVYEAGKAHARSSAPDHAYYAQVRDRKNGKRAALSEARKIVRQACHILAELGDDALAAV